MATLEDFESNLKEAVRGKRLSASKMTHTTEIAIKLMENDTKLVSILYRTHKSLHPACKISGLYAFDALARAAKSYATKHKQTAHGAVEKGNCASFLLKLEGVLDGLVKDMLKSGHEEAKEKTKKVIDIWTKAGTFPPAVLERLSNKLESSDQEPATPSESKPQAPSVSTPPSSTPPAPVAVEAAMAASTDPQAALMALLSQAASAASANGQIPPNTAGPHLDAIQSAILQQLAQTTQASVSGVAAPALPFLGSGSGPAPPINGPPPFGHPSFPPPNVAHPLHGAAPNNPRPPPFTAFGSGGPPSGPLHGPQNGPPFSAPGGDPRFRAPPPDTRDPRSRGPEHRIDGRGPRDGGHGSGPDRDPRRDDRQRFEGRDPRFGGRPQDSYEHETGSRGGGHFNGRGGFRGGDPRRRGDWDNHGRFESGDRRPHGRSRSQSPPGARYPPPNAPPPSARDRSMNMQPESHAAQGKDEFGRDIRSGSPEQDRDEPPVPSRPPHAPEPLGVPEPAAPPPSAESRVTGLPAPHMAAAPAAAVTPAAPPVLTTGLEALDFSSLDFSAPAAWETLGQAWKITHGVAPTQEQLMQFIMSGGQVQAPASNDVGPAAVAQSASGGGGYAGQDDAYMNWGYQGRGSGPGRGRGGGRPRETRGPYTGGGDSVDEYTIPVFESGGNR